MYEHTINIHYALYNVPILYLNSVRIQCIMYLMYIGTMYTTIAVPFQSLSIALVHRIVHTLDKLLPNMNCRYHFYF